MKNFYKRLHRQPFRIGAGIRYIPVLCFLLLFTFCGKQEQQPKKAARKAAPSLGDVNIIECKGSIEAKNHFRRYLMEEETITAIHVKEGTEVPKGTLLVSVSNYPALEKFAQLNYRKLQHNDKINNLKILRLEISKTKRQIKELQKELEEEKKLAATVADYPLEIQSNRLKKDLKRLKEELKIQEEKQFFLSKSAAEEKKIITLFNSHLSEAGSRLKGLEVRAPFDGRVVFTADSLSGLRPGDLVLEFLDDRELYVKANVWQHQLQYISEGGEVKIYPDFFGESFLKGRVRKIQYSSIQDKRDQYPKFPVYINIEKQDIKNLKVGMSVTVKIQKPDKKSATCLRRSNPTTWGGSPLSRKGLPPHVMGFR
ncbi:MAG: HlyD family efflux transporter periplasmic adaptor subunit, partial [bacterium]|nr:HlyD family efflux transporter periplasmic adaptor subunit [bacterium]